MPKSVIHEKYKEIILSMARLCCIRWEALHCRQNWFEIDAIDLIRALLFSVRIGRISNTILLTVNVRAWGWCGGCYFAFPRLAWSQLWLWWDSIVVTNARPHPCLLGGGLLPSDGFWFSWNRINSGFLLVGCPPLGIEGMWRELSILA